MENIKNQTPLGGGQREADVALVVWQCAVLAGRNYECITKLKIMIAADERRAESGNIGGPSSSGWRHKFWRARILDICHSICLRHNIQHSGLARIDSVMYAHELQRFNTNSFS
jgi:hypothetical protein